MIDTVQFEPARLFCGIIAADQNVMRQAESGLAGEFGPAEMRSAVIPFDFTDYYRAEMGENLLRRFVAFGGVFDTGRLAVAKQRAILLEAGLALSAGAVSRRRVNLDPGYVTAAKVVLATTKNHAHRIHLGSGIYGEITLSLSKRGAQAHDWTYPDYRTAAYGAFFMMVRDDLLRKPGSS